MNDIYLKLSLDPNKRHFVVGDVHGRYDTFLELLRLIDYNQDTDIIYSVGDLIDRGPKSYEVLQHFDQPNHYAVRGNHEDMVVNRWKWQSVWLNNGGYDTIDSLLANGLKKEGDEFIKWLETYCKKLPYIIDVGEQGEEHAFRIVHAEVPPQWNEEYFQRVINDRLAALDIMMWSRTTIERACHNVKMMKPSHFGIEFTEDRSGRNIFVGHTPIHKPMVVGDMTFIDTYRSKTMTMVNAVTQERFTTDVIDKNP